MSIHKCCGDALMEQVSSITYFFPFKLIDINVSNYLIINIH